jgi:hypothetical protein
MTPSTRKMRSEGLFQGSRRDIPKTLDGQASFGSIYVEEKTSIRALHDEAVMISYAEDNTYIPSILSFWKGESKPIRLPGMRLGGQIPRSISTLLTSESSNPSAGLFDTITIPNFLVQTSHRLILSMNPLATHASATGASTQSLPVQFSDQALLASGDLDVEGMDRILQGMGENPASKKPMNLFTKSVGFRIDDQDEDGDGDVDMTASPTPANHKRFRNGHGRPTPDVPMPKRRIFT